MKRIWFSLSYSVEDCAGNLPFDFVTIRIKDNYINFNMPADYGAFELKIHGEFWKNFILSLVNFHK